MFSEGKRQGNWLYWTFVWSLIFGSFSLIPVGAEEKSPSQNLPQTASHPLNQSSFRKKSANFIHPAHFLDFNSSGTGYGDFGANGRIYLTGDHVRVSSFSKEAYRLDFNQPFDGMFLLNFGTQEADGMAFVLHNDPAGSKALTKSSNQGSTLGVYGDSKNEWSAYVGPLGSIQKALAIEFDTYPNVDGYLGFDREVPEELVHEHMAYSYPGDWDSYDYFPYNESVALHHYQLQNLKALGDYTYQNGWTVKSGLDFQFYFSFDGNYFSYFLVNPRRQVKSETVYIPKEELFSALGIENSSDKRAYWGFTAANGDAKGAMSYELKNPPVSLLSKDLRVLYQKADEKTWQKENQGITLQAGENFYADAIYEVPVDDFVLEKFSLAISDEDLFSLKQDEVYLLDNEGQVLPFELSKENNQFTFSPSQLFKKGDILHFLVKVKTNEELAEDIQVVPFSYRLEGKTADGLELMEDGQILEENTASAGLTGTYPKVQLKGLPKPAWHEKEPLPETKEKITATTKVEVFKNVTYPLKNLDNPQEKRPGYPNYQGQITGGMAENITLNPGEEHETKMLNATTELKNKKALGFVFPYYYEPSENRTLKSFKITWDGKLIPLGAIRRIEMMYYSHDFIDDGSFDSALLYLRKGEPDPSWISTQNETSLAEGQFEVNLIDTMRQLQGLPRKYFLLMYLDPEKLNLEVENTDLTTIQENRLLTTLSSSVTTTGTSGEDTVENNADFAIGLPKKGMLYLETVPQMTFKTISYLDLIKEGQVKTPLDKEAAIPIEDPIQNIDNQVKVVNSLQANWQLDGKIGPFYRVKEHESDPEQKLDCLVQVGDNSPKVDFFRENSKEERYQTILGEKEPLYLVVNKGPVLPGTYRSTVTWTLSNIPKP